MAYLNDFVQRYKGNKMERARELFSEACENAPPDAAKAFFLKYAAFEEQYGLSRNAMAVYENAVKKIQKSDRLEVYQIYIARATEFFGIGKVREIYEDAIGADESEGLNDSDTLKLCVQYSSLERRLGEIDRARAILIHGSAMADPQRQISFWKDWNDFEVKHGNEETFREMLRIKRSVAAAFSQQHFNTAIIDAASVAAHPAQSGVKDNIDTMAALEEQITGGLPAGTRVPGFVSAGIIEQSKDQQGPEEQDANKNPEDIDLGDEEGEEDISLATKEVPAAVFGGVQGS